MHNIDGSGHLNGTFVAEDPFNNQPGTLITQDWLNAVQAEIVNVILAAGITLNKQDNTQLLDAIAYLVTNGQLSIGDATDTVKGLVSLAVTSNFPSTSNTEAVTPAYLNAALAQLTSQQDWVDVTNSRSANVNYTNSSNRYKFVSICAYRVASAGNATAYVNNTIVAQIQNFGTNDVGTTSQIFLAVPPGKTYSFSAAATFWSELG